MKPARRTIVFITVLILPVSLLISIMPIGYGNQVFLGLVMAYPIGWVAESLSWKIHKHYEDKKESL